MKMLVQPFAAALILAMATPQTAWAEPVARFSEINHVALGEKAAPAGFYRNPVLPGFQPDPSVVRVGADYYLVNSTFSWFPGIPVYHSRDLVNWRLISHAIDRPGMLDFSGLKMVTDGVYAPTISFHDGMFYILNTCVRCRDNFYVSARDPAGPWSDPVWLPFGGFDPALFFDDDGRAYVVNTDEPAVTPRYSGHKGVWLQEVDLAAGKMKGPRTLLVDGGVVPSDNPIWSEGPHIFRHEGWYYLMPAEGGTAEDHSQTIYRSRKVDGPYVAGPVNPILTQRDLPRDRPDRVEATGHADVVQLEDGSWWGLFLATRPFAGQSSLLGRETWLLPVTWQDGWPIFLAKGKPVPLVAKAPALPAGPKADWSKWRDSFDAAKLSPEWLIMRNPAATQWFALDRDRGQLQIIAGADAASSFGQPHFLGRRLRAHTTQTTARFAFSSEQNGDLAGLMAFASEDHFLVAGIEQGSAGQQLVVRSRSGAGQAANGEVIAAMPVPNSEVELRLTIDKGTAAIHWRPAGKGKWRVLAAKVDVEHMASIHTGLFTGVTVGPYAVKGGR